MYGSKFEPHIRPLFKKLLLECDVSDDEEDTGAHTTDDNDVLPAVNISQRVDESDEDDDESPSQGGLDEDSINDTTQGDSPQDNDKLNIKKWQI